MNRKGQILAYSHAARAGIIRSEDKSDLHFSLKEWLSTEIEPKIGLFVEFQQGPRQMTAVKVRYVAEL